MKPFIQNGIAMTALLLAMLFTTACESATQTDTFDEAMASVPHLNLLEGADQVVATVNRERNRTNFTLQLDNLGESSPIQPGSYEAFCALWDVSINSGGGTYGDVKVHEIMDKPYWNTVNYMVNRIDHYYAKYEDLTWLDVQIAKWSAMEHNKFDMNTIEHDDLPRDVREGNYSEDLVQKLVANATENSENFDPEMANYNIYYGDFEDVQDQIIIERGADIDNIFRLYLQNFGNGHAASLSSGFFGNSISQSGTWNTDSPNHFPLKVEDKG